MFKKSKCFFDKHGWWTYEQLEMGFFCFKMSYIFDISKLNFFYFPNEIIKNSSLWWLRMAAGGGTRLALMCTLRCCDCVHAGRHFQSHWSHAGSHFYGTGYEILADFGPVGNRGHSTTTWTEFCHFLPPPPPAWTVFIPWAWTKADIFVPLPPPLILST